MDKVKSLIFDENNNRLKVLNQLRLPEEIVYCEIKGTRDGFHAIKDMLVRGAPCIAAVGCLSLVVELNSIKFESDRHLLDWLEERVIYLISSRPTAVNLKQALLKLLSLALADITDNPDVKGVIEMLTKRCIDAMKAGLSANLKLADFGAQALTRQISTGDKNKVSVLTICNTGALATVGHGTALGVIRTLHHRGNLDRAYCTETRPYNQGSRLTAWELVQENIPATLIADNMISYVMSTRKIDVVVVGADRVVANGDTANKIGTLQLAIICAHFKVPFYVAAPTQSIDLETPNGNEINIEMRPIDELKRIDNVQLAPKEIDALNPCFDVTLASLITGIITEHGVCLPSCVREFVRSSREKNCDRQTLVF